LKIRIITLVQLVLLIGFMPGRAQQLILNGSFESPVVPTTSILGLGTIPGVQTFVDAGSPNNGITSWSVTQGTVSLINNGSTVVSPLGFATPPDGNQFAVLNSISISAMGAVSAGGLGTLQQTFTTVAGNAYQLSFDYTGIGVNPVNGMAAFQVTVSNSSGSTAPNGGAPVSVAANTFQNQTFNFVATGTSSTLTFNEPAGSLANANGVGLDDVTVTNLGMVPVPEFPQFAGISVGFLSLLVLGRLFSGQQPKSSDLPSPGA
jgi:Protein of unknown function (DUF642)